MSYSDDLVVRLSGVARTFPGAKPVPALRGIDLDVARGDYVAVIGPSGSGKSTLLNILGLLDSPTSGTYLLDGIDVGALVASERAALRGHRIGFVFQDFQLIGARTALENVALGALYTGPSLSARTADAAALLERVGLGHRVHSLPSVMSGGERQRVAIARALMGSPSLLLCDEPTGNLDSQMAEQILDLFDAVHRARTTLLVITHDANTAARARRTLTMRDGTLTAPRERWLDIR